MATVIATINVTFNSNYVGCHRLFWRKTSSGPYTGPVEATPPCTGGGNPCTITFYDVIDTEACGTIDYNGYVQACCEDVTSETGRVPFTVSYTPTPSCLPVTITCDAVSILDLEVSVPGSGYDPLSPPTVTLVGGGYSVLATADAIVGEGSPTNLLITDPGVGPNVAGASYPGVTAASIVGTGTSITMTVSVINTGTFTTVNAITITASSDDWTVGDTFTIDPTAIGNVGTVLDPVNVEVGATDEGTIIGFTITNYGAGYSSDPVVLIDPPTVGTQAEAAVIMAPCADSWVVGYNCEGVDYSSYPIEPALGQSFIMCFPGGTIDNGSVPSDYTVAANTTDCCSTCVQVQFQNTGPDPVDVAYTDCNTLNPTFKDVVSATIGASSAITICCAVQNSWAFTDETNIITTVIGDCNCTPP